MNQDKIKDPIQNKLFIEKLKEIYKLLHNIQKLNTPDHSLAEIDENYIKPMIEFIKEFELFDEPEPYITIRSIVDDPNKYDHFITEYTKIYYKDDPTQFVYTLMTSNVDAFPLEHFYETIFNSINSQSNQLNKEEQFDDEFNQLLEKIQSIANSKIYRHLKYNLQNLKESTPSKFVQLKSWNNNRNFSTDTAISLVQSVSKYQKQVELETYRKYKDLFLTIKCNIEDSTERLNKFDEVLKDLEHDSEYISHGYLDEDLIIDTKEYNINNHQIKF